MKPLPQTFKFSVDCLFSAFKDIKVFKNLKDFKDLNAFNCLRKYPVRFAATLFKKKGNKNLSLIPLFLKGVAPTQSVTGYLIKNP